LCHRHDIPVVPLVGPSSLMLALMASGLEGQRFAFGGYLPARPDARRAALRAAEQRSARLQESDLFIETPYRNDVLLADMLRVLSPATRLCLAADLTLPTQSIRTRTVAGWQKEAPVIGKRPCVFILLAGAAGREKDGVQRPSGRTNKKT
ncbi:MAG: SAM-dependent methyltransferase, partial [Bacteroidales bacterium]|nr:SAM-dependent methyltransferase [Bacteroidales bacterium]